LCRKSKTTSTDIKNNIKYFTKSKTIKYENYLYEIFAFTALILLVGHQEEHATCTCDNWVISDGPDIYLK